MKKIKKIARDVRGMTLLELIAAMMLFAVVATSASAVLAPILKAYGMANELAETNALLDSLSAELLSDLSEASAISVSGDKITIVTGQGRVEYYVYPTDGPNAGKRGVLCRGGDAPVLEKGYYKGKSVNIEYLAGNGGAAIPDGDIDSSFYIKLTITSGRDGNVLAFREYAVNPLCFRDYRA